MATSDIRKLDNLQQIIMQESNERQKKLLVFAANGQGNWAPAAEREQDLARCSL